MTPLRERNRFRVGLTGLVVVALVAGVVVVLSRLALGAHSYTAVLEHTGGLRVGEEVQVAGVGAGEVTAIELGEKRVEVEFTLDDDVTLGDRTSAEVKVATLLGTHFLQVSPAGGGELEGGTIPVSRTTVPFNLQDVLDEAVPEVDAFDAVAIEKSLGQLAETLDTSAGDLGPALDGVRQLSTVVAGRTDDLGALLRAARRVTHQLAANGDDLVPLMRQADLILDALRSRRATVHVLLRDLADLGEQLDGVVRDTRADLAPTLRDLGLVTDLLERHADDLGRTARSLRLSTRYFANAGGTGPWLDQYVPGATPDNLGCIEKGACR